MLPYKVFLHADLLEQIPTKGKQRQWIMAFIRQLSSDPQTLGDYATRDQNPRTLEIKIVGDYAITFWVDDPAHSVMVVSVRLTDH